MLAGDRSQMPGMIRASFGLYNSLDDIDAFIEAIKKIARGEYKGDYRQEISTGEYRPTGWKPDFSSYYTI